MSNSSVAKSKENNSTNGISCIAIEHLATPDVGLEAEAPVTSFPCENNTNEQSAIANADDKCFSHKIPLPVAPRKESPPLSLSSKKDDSEERSLREELPGDRTGKKAEGENLMNLLPMSRLSA